MGENGQGAGPTPVPVVGRLEVVLYADGNFGIDAPYGNIPVCHTLVGLAMADLAYEQARRTRRDVNAIVKPPEVGMGLVKP